MSEMQPDAIDRAWNRHLHPRCPTCGSDDPVWHDIIACRDTFHQSDTESPRCPTCGVGRLAWFQSVVDSEDNPCPDPFHQSDTQSP